MCGWPIVTYKAEIYRYRRGFLNMADEEPFEFHIPAEYVYDGMVMQEEINPKELLDRVKELDFTAEDVLLASHCKSGTWL